MFVSSDVPVCFHVAFVQLYLTVFLQRPTSVPYAHGGLLGSNQFVGRDGNAWGKIVWSYLAKMYNFATNQAMVLAALLAFVLGPWRPTTSFSCRRTCDTRAWGGPRRQGSN